MKVVMLTVDFYLDGCRSLKEKRSRLSGFRERFGKQAQLALCECGFQDDHKRSRWAFVAVSSNSKVVDKIFSGLEDYLQEEVDARVVDLAREEL